jgi:hypothetical protein
VFFIHIDTSCSGEKSNSIPFPSANSLRYIRPVSFSCSVVAISTEKTCTPFLVTISSGWTVAARAAGDARAPNASVAARQIQSRASARRRITVRSEIMDDAYLNRMEDFGRP